MSKKPVNVRMPESLIEAVEELADQQDVSTSEAWRSVASAGVAQVTDLDHRAMQQRRERIIEEERPAKQEAWFRSNAGGRLLTCWNAGLTPDEARSDLQSYIREAEEIHEREDLADYVRAGLDRYEEAYPDKGGLLSDWVKGPSGRDVDLPDSDAHAGDADSTVSTDPDSAADGERLRYQQAVDNALTWIQGDVYAEIDAPEDVDMPDRLAGEVDPDTFAQDVRGRLAEGDEYQPIGPVDGGGAGE